MKREILFRGKLCHERKWVEGNFIIAKNVQPYIIPSAIFEPDGHHLIIDSDNPFWVIPETVGQFTGLTDKNGVKIFEGDILIIKNKQSGLRSISSYQEYQPKEGGIFYVKATIAGFMLCNRPDCDYINEHHNIDNYSFWNNSRSFVVSGNIHDNPELLHP